MPQLPWTDLEDSPEEHCYIYAVGTSTGVVIPKEMLNRMKVTRGDVLHVVETPDGYRMEGSAREGAALKTLR